jgi:hypothetical protein
MAVLIDRISQQLAKTGLEYRTKKSRDWLKKKITSLGNVSGRAALRDDSRRVNKILPGRMYLYMYDPKTKDELPFYDTFPLVFPIERYNDGFLGLNLHYIRPNQRLAFLDKLYETLNNDKFNDRTKLKISYDLLNGASRFPEFAPCLKRYLSSHIRSNIIQIPSDEWEIVALLPFDNFVNASREQVYRNSKRIINGI